MRLFRHPGVHLLIFCLFLTLFNWPVLTIPEQRHDQTFFNYLFFVWGLLILLLFSIGMSVGRDEQTGE